MKLSVVKGNSADGKGQFLLLYQYETGGFSLDACNCQRLLTSCSLPASAMPEHGLTWLNNASLPHNMLPAVLKARPLGATSARGCHFPVPAEKICSRKKKKSKFLTPACDAFLHGFPGVHLAFPHNRFCRSVFLQLLPCQDAHETRSEAAEEVQAD